MPSAWPANTCPRGMDWMPARMISLKYAASKAMKVMTAERSAPTGAGPMNSRHQQEEPQDHHHQRIERMPLT